MNKVWLIPIVLITYLFIQGCSENPEMTEDFEGCAVYCTEHFRIYYRECEYSLQDVKRFAEKKERLLRYINEFLKVNYDGVIDTYFHLAGTISTADQNEVIHECYLYVSGDSGHEIIHVVTFETLGFSCSQFLREGIAEAVKLDLNCENAILRFVDYVKYMGKDSDLPLKEKLLDNKEFEVCTYDYYMAGAIIKYLICRWSVEKVKELYISSVNCSNPELPNKFKSVFGASIEDIKDDFEKRYFQ